MPLAGIATESVDSEIEYVVIDSVDAREGLKAGNFGLPVTAQLFVVEQQVVAV